MIEEYTLGAYPMSIGTSLAFEGLFGNHPERPKQPDQSGKYRTVWINLLTLSRNAIAAYDDTPTDKLTVEQIVKHLHTDVMVIDNIIKERKLNLKVFYYVTTQKEIKKRFKDLVFFEPQSENTKLKKHLEDASVIKMASEINSAFTLDHFDVRISEPTLFLTHVGWDLMTQSNRTMTALLESHTGKVKPPSQWYTKLNTPLKLPFLRSVMAICGDRHLLGPITSHKRKLTKIAKLKEWHPNTDLTKIMRDLREAGYVDVVEFITKYR